MLVTWDEVPWDHARLVRFYDLAATKPRPGKTDPDYTAGALVAEVDGEFYLADMVTIRDRPPVVLSLIWRTWIEDWERTGYNVSIRVEQEGGSGGPFAVSAVRKHMTDEWIKHRRDWELALLSDPALPSPVPDTKPDVQGAGTKGIPKAERIKKVSVEAARGHWHIVDAEWTEAFLDEIEAYPDPDVHDDQADAVAGAQTVLSRPQLAAGRSVERADDPVTPATVVPTREEPVRTGMVRRPRSDRKGTSFVVR
jgi:phage terminase large subunit-like protein